MLHVDKHVRFFERVLTMVPEEHASAHLGIVYFCVLGLALLRRLSDPLKSEAQNYIKGLVVDGSGFRLHNSHSASEPPNTSAAYFALAVLHMTGGIPDWVNRDALAKSLQDSQTPQGTFSAMPHGRGESSLRHAYSAVAALRLLGTQLPPPQAEKLAHYIYSTLDPLTGGYSDAPLLEVHAGLTYCAVSCLSLCSQNIRFEGVQHFLALRQFPNGGFNGRPNKPVDTCYSFWVLGSLGVLGDLSLVDLAKAREFLLEVSQDTLIGGFTKVPGETPDPLHSALALGALALAGEPEVARLDPLLSIVR